MTIILLLGLVALNQPVIFAQDSRIRIVYSPSNEDFVNPERGFMKQSSIWVDQPLDPTKIRAIQPSDTLVWIYFRLDNYRDPRDSYGVTMTDYQGQLIDADGLATVQSAFTTARNKRLKLVIRFIYNPGPGSSSDPNQVNPDVPLSLVLQHIDQLKPVIIQNQDVIAAMQVGFVGHWGEWHSSKYLSTLDVRKQIIDTLLTVLPKERMLMLRYPRYKQVFYGGPITQSQAYFQSDISRIGTHDDAFLKDDTDDGTFKSNTAGTKITTYCDNSPVGETQCWRDFVSQDSRFTPVGGEASVYNPPRSSCSNALAQMANMHWSFINNGFNTTVLENWVSEGCMPEIRRRLGYRLVLKEASIPQIVQPGARLDLDILLHNEGFASMYNPRTVFVVLQNTSHRYEIPLLGTDPRLWEAGKDHRITISVPLPSNLAVGVYQLGLWLPDTAGSLKTLPSYTVRFANTNVWDPATGVNILSSNVKVGESTFSFRQLLAGYGNCGLVCWLDSNHDGKLNSVDLFL